MAMTNVECLMTKEWQSQNDDQEWERRFVFWSFVLPSSFVLCHSLTSTHSRAIPHSSSSPADYRSVFPSPLEAEALPSFCATSARAPIHRDDKATPRAS